MIASTTLGSILDGFEDVINRGDIEHIAKKGNELRSTLREIFPLYYTHDKAFGVRKIDDDYALTVNESDCVNGMVNMVEPAKGITFAEVVPGVDLIHAIGGLKLSASGLWRSELNEMLCKRVVSDRFWFSGIKSVTGMELSTKTISRTRLIPGFHFSHDLERIEDTTLEIDYSVTPLGTLHLNSIPTFKNVSSKSILSITIEDDKAAGTDVLSHPALINLFEFGYELGKTSGADMFYEWNAKYTKIKSFKDIVKLVRATDFYSACFSEWPYRLKANAKLSDVIDVTKFESLDYVIIQNSKIGIIFDRVDNVSPVSEIYFVDMLKASWNYIVSDNNTSPLSSIPTTSDGWRVTIFRK